MVTRAPADLFGSFADNYREAEDFLRETRERTSVMMEDHARLIALSKRRLSESRELLGKIDKLLAH